MDSPVTDREAAEHRLGEDAIEQPFARRGDGPTPGAWLDVHDLNGHRVARFGAFDVDRAGDGVDRRDIHRLEPAVTGGEEAFGRFG